MRAACGILWHIVRAIQRDKVTMRLNQGVVMLNVHQVDAFAEADCRNKDSGRFAALQTDKLRPFQSGIRRIFPKNTLLVLTNHNDSRKGETSLPPESPQQ